MPFDINTYWSPLAWRHCMLMSVVAACAFPYFAARIVHRPLPPKSCNAGRPSHLKRIRANRLRTNTVIASGGQQWLWLPPPPSFYLRCSFYVLLLFSLLLLLPLLFSCFCSCVWFCRYGPLNCISFHKFSWLLCIFRFCSYGLISALLVLSTIYIYISLNKSLLQPWYNP